MTFDGGIGEIDEDSWRALSLSRAEPPEGWDALNVADLGDSDVELPEEDPEVTVQLVEVVEEVWENSTKEERDLVVGWGAGREVGDRQSTERGVPARSSQVSGG